MNWRNGLQSAFERVVESPKTTAAVSAFSTTAGLASFQQWITGMGASLAVWGGLIGVLVLARLNWIKSENEKIRGRMLRKKADDLGIDLMEDEE